MANYRTSLVSGGSTGATLAYAVAENRTGSFTPSSWTVSASDEYFYATLAIRSSRPVPLVLPAAGYA